MIHSSDRFGTTWWGRLWISALERLGDDYENRLPRGKKYAEEGAVSHFTVHPGQIEARVHGRKTYNVTLGLPALTEAQWEKAVDRIALESRFVASLLAGEMPRGLDETFREAGASLYPRVPKELQTHCDCPDWANPCKHVAAVCYIMAEALDRDPWLLFDLRGMTREAILDTLQARLDEAETRGTPPPRRRGRPKKTLSVGELLTRPENPALPFRAVSEEAFDCPPEPLPDIPIPRQIPPDPAVFTQLGPLPHARIEASLCLAALMHRGAQWVQMQIEEGASALEDPGPEAGGESQASPFDSPLPPAPARVWKHRRRRWKGKG
ncbi:MAG: SWIM zinc finger family protein [Acidobacteria bacterium]|nr:SWIM zinc finger family protein [Acidobacteriota bacterium]